MLAFLLFLVIVWIVLGILGAVVHGLLWLLILAAVGFLATVFFSGNRFAKRKSRR